MINTKNLSVAPFLIAFFFVVIGKAQLYNDPATWNRSRLMQTASYYPAALQSYLFHRNPNEDRSNLEALDFSVVLNTLRLNDVGSEKLLAKFLLEYPTSNSIQFIPYDIANYYFDQGKYRYALKWFSKVNESQVPKNDVDRYNFNRGYTLFSAKRYKAAQPFLEKVKTVKEYQSNAYYYLGHIAYQQEDFTTANQQFKEVSEEKQKEDLAYFQVDMNFRLGRFEKAISLGKDLLKIQSDKELLSEVSKIIGESHFNLAQYAEALPFLEQYEGKNEKWKNIDFYQLGFVYYKIGEYEQAINQFNKILSKPTELAQSAYYYLGDSYLKTNKKTAALNAFRSAGSMNFDASIEEDASLQYAKLSYEIGNPYEDTSTVLIRFLEMYPETESKKFLSEYLLDSYTISGNYDAALEILENNKAYKNPVLLQKISYLKAVKTYQSGNYNGAMPYFERAIKVNERSDFVIAALYWQGRSLYELNRYDAALDLFKKVKKSNSYKKIKEAFRVDYDMAYTYFKLGEYEYAFRFFESFLKQKGKETSNYDYDIQLRMGDCQFALKRYWPAMEFYNNALAINPKNAVYASYQKAISYGFVDRNDQKIESLNNLVSQYPKASLTDDAWFQLGIAYTSAKEYEAALGAYETLNSYFPRSLYVPKSILNQGLILYNRERNNEAQKMLRKLVEEYPKDAVSVQALNTLKEIAVDLGQVGDFSQWLRKNKINTLSEIELEGTAFAAAEKRFIENDKKQAQKLLEEYLNAYPSGINQLTAQFYLAEIFYEKENYEKASSLYEELTKSAPNEYHEKALVRLIRISQIEDRLNTSKDYLEELLSVATFDENKEFAQLNLMQVYFRQNNFKKALEISQTVLDKENLIERLKWDALTIQARSAKAINDTLISIKSYEALESSPKGTIAAEALYFRALREHNNSNLEKSNNTIIKIASIQKGGIWNAKALFLLAKNFHLLKDPFQANYILESLLKTYPEEESVVEKANELLEMVKDELTKNNASVDADE